MYMNTLRAAVIAMAAAPLLLIAGTSHATSPPPEFIGGRERVKVTVTSTEPVALNCTVNVDGFPKVSFFLPVGEKASAVVPAVAPGDRDVEIVCNKGFVFPPISGKRHVAVELANPALDAVDGLMLGAGSSNLTTDPTLR